MNPLDVCSVFRVFTDVFTRPGVVMSGTTCYSPRPADAAGVCRAAAAEIGAGLGALRAKVGVLDPAWPGVPATRLAELLAGFDIYARMLGDALADIARELRDHRWDDRPASSPVVVDRGPVTAGATVTTVAAEVAARLAELRRILEPTRHLWCGPAVELGPAEEWTIAADGLFGTDGVLAQISRAMGVDWPVFPALGWADGEARPDRPPLRHRTGRGW